MREMAEQSGKVIPIRKSAAEEIVERAFAYWQERFGSGDCSPKEHLLRAHREVLADRRKTRGLYLLPRR